MPGANTEAQLLATGYTDDICASCAEKVTSDGIIKWKDLVKETDTFDHMWPLLWILLKIWGVM